MTARTEYCNRCEHELDDQGHCPKHWPAEFAKLTDFRRQGTVGRVAKKTSLAEDLVSIDGHQLASTVERLLDGLAGLVASTSASKGKNLEAPRGRHQHAPLPHFEPVWADTVADQVDNALWELAEEVAAFLNRPQDPKLWSACDVCGNRRLGESSYCGGCGSRILEGARRCRLVGCPNEGRRRSACPKGVEH